MSGISPWSGLKGFGAAIIAALWAYGGWVFLPLIAGEVKNPGRNIPRALIMGMFVVIGVYCLVNLAYFFALPFEEVVTSHSTLHPEAISVASKAAKTFLGPLGITFISIIFLLSIIGSLHTGILTVPRIFFAMARDRLFFTRFGMLNQHTHVPVFSIGLRAILASVLAMLGTFNQLTTALTFMLCIFYSLAVSSVFMLRRKMPDVPRPYRTLGYPVVPLIYVLVNVWLVINTLQTNPVESVFGLALVFLGLPLYLFFRYKKRRENTTVTPNVA